MTRKQHDRNPRDARRLPQNAVQQPTRPLSLAGSRISHAQDEPALGISAAFTHVVVDYRGIGLRRHPKRDERCFLCSPSWSCESWSVCLCPDPREAAFTWDSRKFAGWDALIIGTQEHIPDVQRQYGKHFRRID